MVLRDEKSRVFWPLSHQRKSIDAKSDRLLGALASFNLFGMRLCSVFGTARRVDGKQPRAVSLTSYNFY